MTAGSQSLTPDARLRETGIAVAAADDLRELAAILEAGAVRSVYQPIVGLDAGELIGYEALARGPRGSRLETPDRLFATAARAGLLGELEWACRAAAVEGALERRLSPQLSLFINVEPSTLTATLPERAEAVLADVRGRLNIVLELTERALAERPSDILSVVPRLRRLGCAIALDDVGADPRSLALMPFLAPEVIKLDLRLVQSPLTPQLAATVHAVCAEAERSGALVLAEGIETGAHERTALALGARLGQGWRFGRPEPLPDLAAAEQPAQRSIVPGADRRLAGDTPYAVVSSHVAPRTGTKRLLHAISRQLEAQVLARGESAVLLATFQQARHLTPSTRDRYERIARSAAFVGAFGEGLPAEPVPGVRGADLSETEPLRGEWNVIVIDPHFAAAFVAQDLGDTGDGDWDRRFAFCLTYDRALAVEAARRMMTRMAPRAPGIARLG